MNFPREVWNPKGAYRVVWGPEEHAQLKAEGWADARPAILTTEGFAGNDLLIGESFAGRPESEQGFAGLPEGEQPSNLPKRRGRPPKVQPISEVA